MPKLHPRRMGAYVCAQFVALAMFAGCMDRPVAPDTPRVTGRFNETNTQTAVSKIDLLFMIDNSRSMSDKQEILAEAIPDLVNRLVDPICVNADGSPAAQKPDSAGVCPTPTQRDFDPVRDIHIGVISSSIGGHGAPGVCDGSLPSAGAHQDDQGHLVARNGGSSLPTFQNLGFLAWNPSVAGAYSDAAKLTDDFRTIVTGVGQDGCGYEAQLEAVYRFLIDPAPYKSISLTGNDATPQGVDEVVLKERADFLRPDSLVAVIAVTDENDYSIVDGGENWLAVAHPEDRLNVKGGTSACHQNPNGPCCTNCNLPDVPNCMAHADDPACASPLTEATDPTNLRASRSKEQYGVEFAWPIERYVEGFTRPTLDKFAKGAKNPLFNDLGCRDGVHCKSERDPGLVFFAGIVGVPWQDIARDPTDLSKGFQDGKELVEKGTWSVILGDPSASPPVLPKDPHMIVSTDPRPGIAGPDSALGADPKNGHEWTVPSDPQYADLQYACTFPLKKPKDCSSDSQNCDCFTGDISKNPLCQSAAGTYGKQQFSAKAYPAIRELELLKGLGEQGVVASICPSNTKDSEALDYGYRPAIAALVARLRQALRGRCLPRALISADDGSVSCVILEAFDPPDGDSCRCEGDPRFRGRVTPSADVLAANPDIHQYGSCVCEIEQLSGSARASCLNDVQPVSGIDGWCYVDPQQSGESSQCEIVRNCPATDKRLIRYVGEQPRGSNLIMCQEKSFPAQGGGMGAGICDH